MTEFQFLQANQGTKNKMKAIPRDELRKMVQNQAKERLD